MKKICCKLLLAGSVLLASVSTWAQQEIRPLREIVFPHGLSSELFLKDGKLFVKNGWTRGYGIMTFDLSNPEKPVLASGRAVPGYVRGHSFSGETMYMASYFGFIVFDTKGGSITLKRNLMLDFSTATLTGSSVYAFGKKLLVQGKESSRIYDITSPEEPILEKANLFPKEVNFASDGKNFYAWNGKQLFAVAPSDFSKKLIREYNAPVKSVICLKPDFLYVLTTDNVMHVNSAVGSEKEFPERHIPDITRIRMTAGGVFAKGKDKETLFNGESSRDFILPKNFDRAIEFDGRYFYILEKDKLCVYKPSGETSELMTTVFISPSDGGLLVTKDAIYISGGQNLFVLDKADKKRISHFDAVLTVPAVPKGVSVPNAYNQLFGNYFLQAGNQIVFYGQLIDISDPLAPKLSASFGSPFNGSYANKRIIALAEAGKVTFYDAEKFPECIVLGTYTPPKEVKGAVLDVKVVGNTASVIHGKMLEIVDISDPATPKLLETLDIDNACMMGSFGNFIYIPAMPSAKKKSVFIYDVANRKMYEREGLLRSGCTAMTISGNQLFMTDAGNVLQFDLADPLNPRRTSVYTYDIPGTPIDQTNDFSALAIYDGVLYARKYSRVTAWNVQNGGK